VQVWHEEVKNVKVSQSQQREIKHHLRQATSQASLKMSASCHLSPQEDRAISDYLSKYNLS
jgi:hypothetical protein